jgi:hypothetical protein
MDNNISNSLDLPIFIETIHLNYTDKTNIKIVIKDSMYFLNNFEKTSSYLEYFENLNKKLKIKNIENIGFKKKDLEILHSSITLFYIISNYMLHSDYQCNTDKTFYSKKNIIDILKNTILNGFNNSFHPKTIQLLLYKGSSNDNFENIISNNIIDENYIIVSGKRFYVYKLKNNKYKNYILIGKFFYEYSPDFLTFEKLNIINFKINNGLIDIEYIIDLNNFINPIIQKKNIQKKNIYNNNNLLYNIDDIKKLKKKIINYSEREKLE